MKKINDKIVTRYIELQKEILGILNEIGMTQKHVYTKVGITRATWIKKIREQKFTTEEMKKICEIINR